MKFNYRLGDYENLKARMDYFEMQNHTEYSALSIEARLWLGKFNDYLTEIESKFSNIIWQKKQVLNLRIDEAADWIDDYEIDLIVTFHLAESDAEYEEDDDNILIQIRVLLGRRDEPGKGEWGFGQTHINHAEPGNHFIEERHCYLYHQLYDHCNLDWLELFRIGYVFIEIEQREQSEFQKQPEFIGQKLSSKLQS